MRPIPNSEQCTPLRNARLRTFIENQYVQHTLVALILANAAILGLETSPSVMRNIGPFLIALDQVILAIFVVEIAIRLHVYRLGFWRNPWGVFDFTVVAIALIPASGPFAVLRALRVLRVLRLLTMIPSMRKVVGALLGSLPGLASIFLILAIFYYVFAVIATNLFAANYPEFFGTLGASLYTLFQIMTLESWSMEVVRPVMEQHPYAWVFFIPFILITTFTILNLFIAIIVSAMQTVSEQEHQEPMRTTEGTQDNNEKDMHTELRQLHIEITELKQMLESSDARPRT